ncbi:NAD-dependent epimerase/dehydratase family protein [Fulvivirga kasyanovii]
MMKVIITGATGMIGKGVLLECLDHEAVDRVLVLGRSSVGVQHNKLRELLHDNFEDYSEIKDEFKGYDACFYCLGVSAAGMKEERYTTITYNYTLALAKTLHVINPNMTFTYVSGEGTDSTEKGSSMWARVKGKTENDLLNIGFRQAFMYRPGAIIPLKGIKSRTKIYQFIYDYFMWLIKLLEKLSPDSIVNTTDIGLSMINVAAHGYEKNVLRPKDILITARE